MAKPKITELRKVLTKQDWQWLPYFKITPLKSTDVKQEIWNFYSAVDKHLEEYEISLRNKLDKPKFSSLEGDELKCRNALMTYTHIGMRKPFTVQHRHFLEQLGIYGLWRKHNNLWYFAIAWQFNEWYDHVLEVYEDSQHETFSNLIQEASEQFEGGLSESLSIHFLGKGVELLESSLDNLINEGDKYDFYHKKLFLDTWLNLRGIELNVSERDEVVGWTFGRFRDD